MIRNELYFRIYKMLKSRPGVLVSQRELLEFIDQWRSVLGRKNEYSADANVTLKALIYKIRKEVLRNGDTIENIHGQGYIYRSAKHDKRQVQVLSSSQHLDRPRQTTAPRTHQH